MQGLLDIAFLGTVMELSWLMDQETYRPERTIKGVDYERAYAIRGYIKFNRVFNDRQDIRMNGERQEPRTAIFNPMMHKVAVTLYKYMLRQPNNVDFHAVELRANILRHMDRFRPDLKSVVERDMRIAAENLPFCKTFEWQGPDFTVVRKVGGDLTMTGMSNLFGYSVI